MISTSPGLGLCGALTAMALGLRTWGGGGGGGGRGGGGTRRDGSLLYYILYVID